MKLQDTISSIFGLVIILAFSYIAYSGINQYFSLKQQELKNNIINTCMQNAGIYEYTDPKNGIHSTAPQGEIYKSCLRDKGYSVPQN